LFNNGADVNCKTADGWNPLYFATISGRTEIVRFLASNGANVNWEDKDGRTPLYLASICGNLEAAFVLIDHGADLSIKNRHGKTALDFAERSIATKLTEYAKTLKENCPAAIQDKLIMLIQESKQQKSEMTDLQDRLKTTTAALSEDHKIEIAALRERLNTTTAALSEEHKIEIAALQEKLKTTTAALSEEHKIEIAAIRDQLNTVLIQENERLKSAKSLAGPELAKIETAQAKDDRIFNLMMKRKELESVGFSASEIDEQLPLPGKDEEDLPSKKRRRRVVKTEEETQAFYE
jgi:hypothetical protein